MQIEDINFSGFAGREGALKKIGRFHMYSPMFYRPDVFFHSRKVFYLLRVALPRIQEVFGGRVDLDKILVMALVHDDAEIITGDIQAGKRAKMSDKEVSALEITEEAAINKLAEQYPETIGGYSYNELLLEVMHKKTLEAQIVKYIDHFDALCEAMHEMLAGNKTFISPYIDPVLGEVELPYQYYFTRFNDCQLRYPLIGQLLSDYPPFLSHYDLKNVEKLVSNGRLHTLESLKTKTGIVFYDRRKGVLMKNLGSKELKHLILPKER